MENYKFRLLIGSLILFCLLITEGLYALQDSLTLIPKSSPNWTYTIDFPITYPAIDDKGNNWYEIDYDDSDWKKGDSPLGYGDEPRAKYGTLLYNNQGSYYFRKSFKVDENILKKISKDKLILRVSSDNSAKVYLNAILIDTDPAFGKPGGHEFAYWNREISIGSSLLKVGKNLLAIHLYNNPGSSDAYIDIELSLSEKPSSSIPYNPPSEREPLPLLTPLRVKNVIFLIGDGMGISQIMAARIKAVGVEGKLHMDRMPVTGLITTHSANALVTDSAAAGTALSTGYKTNNGMISVSPEGRKLTTILEAAKGKGMSTGLVATSSITHATPASFASHVESRSDEVTIAEHLLDNKVNILLGGGKAFFIPSSIEGSKREDERSLIEEAKEKGYLFIETKEELEKSTSEYLLGLFQLHALTTNPPEPTLAELTRKAINLLSKNKKGFFLMVEGSQIDWACHANDIDNTIKQLLLFDQAVKEALEFAVEDRRTLVIVTADHETGGLSINAGNLDGVNIEICWATEGHTATPVPLYAFGPRAEEFMGLHDNTDIPKIIAKLLGIKFAIENK